jgi:HAD superfamily hydrolase (TIGR01509 family)
MSRPALILDLDGTLVDTNRYHVESYIRAFAAHGYDVDRAAIEREVGKGGDKLVPSLLGRAADARHGDAIREEAGRALTEELAKEHTFELMPGAIELLDALRERGIRTAIATSSEEHFLDAIFESAGTDLRQHVDAVTTSGDVEASKPDADVVVAALGKLGVKPSEAALLGDTIYDVQAASACGVCALGVALWTWSREDLEAAGASMTFSDLREVLARLDEALRDGTPVMSER